MLKGLHGPEKKRNWVPDSQRRRSSACSVETACHGLHHQQLHLHSHHHQCRIIITVIMKIMMIRIATPILTSVIMIFRLAAPSVQRALPAAAAAARARGARPGSRDWGDLDHLLLLINHMMMTVTLIWWWRDDNNCLQVSNGVKQGSGWKRRTTGKSSSKWSTHRGTGRLIVMVIRNN